MTLANDKERRNRLHAMVRQAIVGLITEFNDCIVSVTIGFPGTPRGLKSTNPAFASWANPICNIGRLLCAQAEPDQAHRVWPWASAPSLEEIMDRAGTKVRRYLTHAEELRMVAVFVRNPAAVRQMIETAEAYERLAASVLRISTQPHETANAVGMPEGRA